MSSLAKHTPGSMSVKTKPGDTSQYIQLSMKLMAMPSIDLQDPEAVKARLKEYMELYIEADSRPTVAGLGMALGLDRRRLYEIRSGHYHTSAKIAALPDETKDAIKKVYEFMENMWESYMLNNKVNPISGIFFGTNNYGYENRANHVITEVNREEYSVDAIKARYAKPVETDAEVE